MNSDNTSQPTNQSNPNPGNFSAPTRQSRQKMLWILGTLLFFISIGLQVYSRVMLAATKNDGVEIVLADVTLEGSAVDQDGNVFIMQGNSVIMYPAVDEPVTTTIQLPTELAETGSLFAVDQENRIWITSYDTGVIGMLQSNGSWVIYEPENFPEFARVDNIVMDDNGRIWISTRDKLALIDPSNNQTSYRLGNFGLSKVYIVAMSVDNNGKLWILNSNKLMSLESADQWKLRADLSDIDDGTFGNAIIWGDIMFDNQNQAWIDVYNGLTGLVFVGKNGDTRLFESPYGSDPLESIIDADNNAWVTILNLDNVKGNGLFKVDSNGNWHLEYECNNTKLNDDATAHIIGLDAHNRIWLSCYNYPDSTVVAFDPKAISIHELSQHRTMQTVSFYLIIILLGGALSVVIASHRKIQQNQFVLFGSSFWKGFFLWYSGSVALYILVNLLFNIFKYQIGAGATIVAAAAAILVLLAFNIVGAIRLYSTNSSMGHGFICAIVVNFLSLIAIRNITGTEVPPIPMFPFFIYLFHL